eukprot:gene20877-13414_t
MASTGAAMPADAARVVAACGRESSKNGVAEPPTPDEAHALFAVPPLAHGRSPAVDGNPLAAQPFAPPAAATDGSERPHVARRRDERDDVRRSRGCTPASQRVLSQAMSTDHVHSPPDGPQPHQQAAVLNEEERIGALRHLDKDGSGTVDEDELAVMMLDFTNFTRFMGHPHT